MDIQLGNRTLTGVDTIDRRMALLLWGPAGCGKTTLASTAPGVKLWIQFDSDGVLSLAGRSDILVLDLSGEKFSITEELNKDNPFGLEKMLTEHPEIETVVFDSATAYAILATEAAVAGTKSATIENPGMKGYGFRNARVLRAVVALMRLTKRLNRHIIIISHEDTADKDDNGVVLQITLAIGGKIAQQIGLQLSEVWWMQDAGGVRKIATRPVRMRTPMKSRMFKVEGAGEFVWKYNQEEWKGPGIDTWFKAWCDGGGRKIPIPT